jgi:hypothetical protein
MSWMAEMNRELPYDFVSKPVYLQQKQRAYGNETLNRSKVFSWYSQFRDGRELVEDDESGGCPKLT